MTSNLIFFLFIAFLCITISFSLINNLGSPTCKILLPNSSYHKSFSLSKLARRNLLQRSSYLPQSKSNNNDGNEFSIISDNKNPDPESNNKLKYIVPLVIALAIGAIGYAGHKTDFSALLEKSVKKIGELGPLGYLYFALIYIFAELLAIPAMPLTASSGYLFGLVPGTLLVVSSATVAASISFVLGRTFLRNWAQNFIQSSPKWRAIDKAIAKEGFKVVLLLRLSPLLPFALSNYLYAVTSVDFVSFITATFLGFTPGSAGIVYFGSAGKALFSANGGGFSAIPWYGYLIAGALLIIFGQTIAKVATDAIKDMEQEDALITTTTSSGKEKDNKAKK